MVNYTWDPDKDRTNRQKHGLSLEDGIPALEDPDAISEVDDRISYGEERWVTIGLAHRGILTVVTAEKEGDHVRIISVRHANRAERERYRNG